VNKKPFSALGRLGDLFALCKILTLIGILLSIALFVFTATRANGSAVLLQIVALVIGGVFSYVLFDGLSDACAALNQLVYIERARAARLGLLDSSIPTSAPETSAPVQTPQSAPTISH
jgi:hypothetical protein